MVFPFHELNSDELEKKVVIPACPESSLIGML